MVGWQRHCSLRRGNSWRLLARARRAGVVDVVPEGIFMADFRLHKRRIVSVIRANLDSVYCSAAYCLRKVCPVRFSSWPPRATLFETGSRCKRGYFTSNAFVRCWPREPRSNNYLVDSQCAAHRHGQNILFAQGFPSCLYDHFVVRLDRSLGVHTIN